MVIKIVNKERENALLSENVSAILVDYESFNEVKNYNKEKDNGSTLWTKFEKTYW